MRLNEEKDVLESRGTSGWELLSLEVCKQIWEQKRPCRVAPVPLVDYTRYHLFNPGSGQKLNAGCDVAHL